MSELDYMRESLAGLYDKLEKLIDRFDRPPYSDDELEHFAARIRPLLADGVEVFAYFRHEDEPTAPQYAERLLTLLA